MKISKKEWERELLALRAFGVTEEEFDGLMEFFDHTLDIGASSGKIRIVNSRNRKKLESKND